MLTNKLRKKKYNAPEWHNFDKSGFEIQYDVLSCPENIGIKMIIGIEGNLNNPRSFFYGFWLADESGKEMKGEGRQKYLIIVQGALGKGPKDDGYLWYKYFDYDTNENILSLAPNESTFIDKCAAEITDSIEILKNSKQFQDCTWLV